jgi:hypothetical protein
MEPVRHWLDAQQVDVGRQFVVDATPQRFGRQGGHHIEVGNLRDGMHAGIGTARSVQLEVGPAGDLANRAIDFTLHRSAFR